MGVKNRFTYEPAMTIPEIAAALEISEDAVKAALLSAMRKLRIRLGVGKKEKPGAE